MKSKIVNIVQMKGRVSDLWFLESMAHCLTECYHSQGHDHYHYHHRRAAAAGREQMHFRWHTLCMHLLDELAVTDSLITNFRLRMGSRNESFGVSTPNVARNTFPCVYCMFYEWTNTNGNIIWTWILIMVKINYSTDFLVHCSMKREVEIRFLLSH